MREVSEVQEIQAIADRLATMYSVPAAIIEKVVEETHARFDGRPVRSFIPLFVERSAKAQLAKLTG